MSSETFNPEPTQQDTRECQQRKGNVTMSSAMQRQKESGQLWAVWMCFCCSGTLICAAAVDVLNEQNKALMLGSKGGRVHAPYSLGYYGVLAAFSLWILSKSSSTKSKSIFCGILAYSNKITCTVNVKQNNKWKVRKVKAILCYMHSLTSMMSFRIIW